MPKQKPVTHNTRKSPAVRIERAKKTSPARPPHLPEEDNTDEYNDYLERYELYGEGHPRLSPSEFERYDDELLELLELQADQGSLSDDQIVRLQELEFLLLDTEQ